MGRLKASGFELVEQIERRFVERIEVDPCGLDRVVGILGFGEAVHLEHVVVFGLLEDVSELACGLG